MYDALPLHEVIGSELRGPFGKKKKKGNLTKLVAIKTCRPYLFLDDLQSLRVVFLQLLRTTHQGFPISEPIDFTQVSILILQYFFTYLLTDAHLPKTALSWAARILKCFKLPNPFFILSV